MAVEGLDELRGEGPVVALDVDVLDAVAGRAVEGRDVSDEPVDDLVAEVGRRGELPGDVGGADLVAVPEDDRAAAQALGPGFDVPDRRVRAQDVDGVRCGEQAVLDGRVAPFPVAAGDRRPDEGRDLGHLGEIEHREDGRGRRELDDLGRALRPVPFPAGGRERQADPRQDGRVADDVARGEMAEETGLAPADERGIQAEALEMAEGRLDGAPRFEGPLRRTGRRGRGRSVDRGRKMPRPKRSMSCREKPSTRWMRSTTERTSGRAGSAKKESRRVMASWISAGESAAKTSRERERRAGG